METLEQRGFGKFDPANFGLWLNIDPVVTSPLGPDLSWLTLSSFHFPLSEDHKAFFETVKPSDRAFVLNCFTMFCHERRHFHDMLATPYGSVLMRQYTRAAIVCQLCRHDLFFGSDAIAVPLSGWIDNEDVLAQAGVPAASANLRNLHEVFSTAQEKLAVFDMGTSPLPAPFDRVTATSIMEGLAIIFQELEIYQQFGWEAVRCFRSGFADDSKRLYWGALELCTNVLGPNLPMEAMGYCLFASLCGNFQESRPEVPRYPRDLLAALLVWLKRHGGVEMNRGFEAFRAQVDDFFEATYGDDLQGMVIAAAKANSAVGSAFHDMTQRVANETGEGDLDTLPAIFDNFTQVQAAFASNIVMDPSWYCGRGYSEYVATLPIPVIFLETVQGIPVGPLEDVYYIQTESRIGLDGLDPELAQMFSPYADLERVVRLAHVLSPKADKFAAPGKDYPTSFSFKVPPIDVELWQKGFDETGGFLRLLLEGLDGLIKPLAETALLAFAVTGVKVFSMSGELAMPPVPDDPDNPLVDPLVRRMLSDPRFREGLAGLRASRPGASES